MTSAPFAPAIEAAGLRKHYGSRTSAPAVDGLDLTVRRGTIHGLLGPNGAGKTTTVRILTTLLRFDGGHARVAGADVARDAALVRSRIGLAGQHAAVDEILSGRGNLEMFARLHHLNARTARARATAQLERFGLTHAAHRPVSQYSGGMRRRLDLAVSLIREPEVLFLDEPTTGLDPRSRAEVWQAVRELADAGTTVLLTTQYLEEADQLADMISVIDHGHVIAEGTPEELKERTGGGRIELTVADAARLPAAAAAVAAVVGVAPQTQEDGRSLSVPVRHGAATLTDVVRALDKAGVELADIALRQPTLDDAFLGLTERAPEAVA